RSPYKERRIAQKPHRPSRPPGHSQGADDELAIIDYKEVVQIRSSQTTTTHPPRNPEPSGPLAERQQGINLHEPVHLRKSAFRKPRKNPCGATHSSACRKPPIARHIIAEMLQTSLKTA
ncbi:hypothetical protein, partial [Bifidobacterium adolescentis]|uniref:hypothetical protein n=1 Tax=Bifidobacterium adolescentis TaxID=1680 RepID=UPI0022E3E7A2